MNGELPSFNLLKKELSISENINVDTGPNYKYDWNKIKAIYDTNQYVAVEGRSAVSRDKKCNQD